MKPLDHPAIDAGTLRIRVNELARAISRDYEERDLLVLCVLKGALHFASDLLRALEVPAIVDFVRAKSYSGTAAGTVVELLVKPTESLAGRDVLVVEDILDTGGTAATLMEYLSQQGAASVRLCVLLDKPSRRAHEVHADYVGFSIEDYFAVGYGLDYNEQFRELPAIHRLDVGPIDGNR